MKRYVLLVMLLLSPTLVYAQTATISCPATDLDGDALSFTWQPLAGVTFATPNAETTLITFNGIATGTYDLVCMFDDGRGGTGQQVAARLNVLVNNRPTGTVDPNNIPAVDWTIQIATLPSGDIEVRLAWDPSTDPVLTDLQAFAGYNMYRSQNDGAFQLIARRLQTLEYVDTTALEGTTYQWGVSVLANVGTPSPDAMVIESGLSNLVTATITR